MIQVHSTELVLAEMDPGVEARLFSLEHCDCLSIDIRAEKGRQHILGKAHIYLGEDENENSIPNHTRDELAWILDRLSDPAQGYTMIEIIVGVSDRWAGFPKNTTLKDLESMAAARDIKLSGFFPHIRTKEGTWINHFGVITSLTHSLFEIVHHVPTIRFHYDVIPWSPRPIVDQAA